MGEILTLRFDFLLMVHGLSLLFMAIVSLRMFGRKENMRWVWLGLFGISVAGATFLKIVSGTLMEGDWLIQSGNALEALSYFFLAQFGVHSLSSRAFLRPLAYIMLGIMLIVPASIAVIYGLEQAWKINRVCMAPVGGFFSLAGVIYSWRQGKIQDLKFLFIQLAIYITGYTLLAAGWQAFCIFSANTLSVQQGWPPPFLILLNAATATSLSLALIHYAAFHEYLADRIRKRHAYSIGIAAVGVAFFCGFLLTDYLGRSTDRMVRKNLHMRVNAVGNAIDPFLLGRLQGDPNDVGKPIYRQLLKQLIKIKKGNSDLRFIYITTMRPGEKEIVFSLDTEPPTSKDYATPGEVYGEAPTELKAIYSTGKAALVGPYTDRWGMWISGFSPVKDEVGAIMGVVGMDIYAKTYDISVARSRLVGIIITCLLSLLGASVGLILQRSIDLRDANQSLKTEMKQRQETQKRLTASEHQYRNLVERAGDGIAILKDNAIVFANTRLTELLEANEDKIVDRQFLNFFPEHCRETVFTIYQNRLRGEDNPGVHESELLTRAGRLLPVEISAAITTHLNQPSVIMIVRDISERKQLQREKARHMRTIDQLCEDLAALNDPGYIRSSLESLVQSWLPVKKVLVLGPDEDEMIEPIKESEHERMQSGAPFWCEHADFGFGLCQEMKSSYELKGFLFLVPHSVKEFEEILDPVLLALVAKLSGVALHKAETLREVKRLQRMDVYATRKEKDHVVETLAAEVAHEIHYPINYFRLLVQDIRDGETVKKEHADLGLEELERLERMLKTLRRLRHPTPPLQPVAVAAILHRAMQLIRELLEDKRLIPRIKVPDGFIVHADPDRFLQLAVNLLRNAAQAVPKKGLLGVRLVGVENQTILEFYDKGPGVPEHLKTDIFSPWMTTRKTGAGLGLAVCQRIVREFGWVIKLDTGSDQTCFQIIIPERSILTSEEEQGEDHVEYDRADSG